VKPTAYRRLRRFVPLGVLRSDKDYQEAVTLLDKILDEIGQDEGRPLADRAEALALFAHSYETHAKIPEATGPNVLRSLMETHGLTQAEFPEIESSGRVRNPLRPMRTQHSTDPSPGQAIRGLPCRFHHRHMRREENGRFRCLVTRLPLKNSD